MIVDANLLLYAVDSTSRHHDVSRHFLETALGGEVRVGLPWQSLGAFLRISTHPRVMGTPLTAAAAAGHVDDWLSASTAWIPEITEHTWTILRRLLGEADITGNLVPDAQLAALAVQHGVPVASADSDFARFPDVEWVNPVTPRR